MSYLDQFSSKVKFINNNENQKPHAFHILSNEYVRITEDVQLRKNTLNQQDYQNYFAVHQLFIEFMDSFIINAATPIIRSALSDFKNSLGNTYKKIYKEYERKNSFFSDLSVIINR